MFKLEIALTAVFIAGCAAASGIITYGLMWCLYGGL